MDIRLKIAAVAGITLGGTATVVGFKKIDSNRKQTIEEKILEEKTKQFKIRIENQRIVIESDNRVLSAKVEALTEILIDSAHIDERDIKDLRKELESVKVELELSEKKCNKLIFESMGRDLKELSDDLKELGEDENETKDDKIEE